MSVPQAGPSRAVPMMASGSRVSAQPGAVHTQMSNLIETHSSIDHSPKVSFVLPCKDLLCTDSYIVHIEDAILFPVWVNSISIKGFIG
ncbi:hypothetical protein OESDEN_17438 [Oesophagostomum dentatum]|uniref:Uncharacterized protein n=1 Tax=Oesophagostomum dentatum TaxID=61180 RepID=A0A0B1SH37_OESDE|nr:hypothetical protein OESDEN_17438 [Oesophagostomum dentatum]